jgi:hypothetical protein
MVSPVETTMAEDSPTAHLAVEEVPAELENQRLLQLNQEMVASDVYLQ